MNHLSLFDGMSCYRIACDRAGIPVDYYGASEIDRYAIKVSGENWKDITQLGDVQELVPRLNELPKIDVLVGGSPCQGFSFAGKQLNFDDPRSKLFFDFIKIMDKTSPKYFLLENVRMKQESQDIISKYMGVKPVLINSALVSAQNRQRLYWTNIPFDMPEDKGIILRDILESNVPKKYLAGKNLITNYRGGNQLNPNYKSQANTIHNKGGKSGVLCAGTHGYANGYVQGCIQIGEATLTTIRKKSKCVRSGGRGSYDRHEWDSVDELHCRKLTPLECERLQTVPDNYTNHVSNTQRYKMLGNGWTVDVIAHIMKGVLK